MSSPNLYRVRGNPRLYIFASEGKRGYWRWQLWELTGLSDSIDSFEKSGGHIEGNKSRARFAASGPVALLFDSEAQAIDNARRLFPAPAWYAGYFRWIALGVAVAFLIRYLS